MAVRAFINWSSGKDAAFALYALQQDEAYNVALLLTTINSEFNRVSMHGLETALLIKQAEAINIPIKTVTLDGQVSMEDYNAIMTAAMTEVKSKGFSHSIFGDIFLEDLKVYREAQLKEVDIIPVFPLWKKDTRQLARDIINAGFKAIVICTNTTVLDITFCGREFDEHFLNDLPENVDPCGENGEFHTFVYDGPNFKFPVAFKKGDFIDRSYNNKSTKGDETTKQRTWDAQFRYLDLVLN